VVQTLLFNKESIEAVDLDLQKTGQHGNVADAETMLEVNYGFNIAPGVKVTPYFEYIWDPDQLGTSTPQAGITHAIQVGGMLDIELNEMLDLPNLRRVRN
jgi:carbohydrate-selective porin OprB